MQSWKGGLALALVALAGVFAPAGQAGAATYVYPAGGSGFDGGPEGWEATGATCDAALCTASGGYDAAHGDPAGSLAADTKVALNLASLFHSTVTLQSPDFEVGTSGSATLHMERQFDSGSLVDLSPRVDYSVQLVDRTTGKHSTSIDEMLEGAAGWTGENGSATVVGGHTYAIVIDAETSSTVLGSGLLAGSTSARFDNVGLTVDGAGVAGAGKGGGSGSSGAGGAAGGAGQDARLAALAPTAIGGPARVKGRRLIVKARCPKKVVGHTCRLSLLGLLKKRTPATTKRTVKVQRGKTKRLVLKLKPRAKSKVLARKRLLFKVHLRAGGAQATAYKRLRLIRR